MPTTLRTHIGTGCHDEPRRAGATMVGSATANGDPWVDDVLLRGGAGDVCLHIGGPVTRAMLRDLVTQRQQALAAAGVTDGSTVALQLPPSLAFVANLLAVWRSGAQAALLDHRLTQYETRHILDRLRPAVL